MNLFGDSDYLEKLSSKGDPLERLEKVVDFECFRPTLNRIFKKVPDAKTIWNFRNQLSKSNRGNWLFSAFQEKLESQGMIAHKGQIVDATFIEAPKQRNPKDENELIKANRVRFLAFHWERSQMI